MGSKKKDKNGSGDERMGILKHQTSMRILRKCSRRIMRRRNPRTRFVGTATLVERASNCQSVSCARKQDIVAENARWRIGRGTKTNAKKSSRRRKTRKNKSQIKVLQNINLQNCLFSHFNIYI